MIDIFQNPFSHSNFQSTRQTVDGGVQSKVALSSQSLPSVSSLWKIKDEYVPSASTSSETYKRSSVPVNVSDEIVQKGEITNAMREEMKIRNSSWTATDLLPVAYPTFHKIFRQVLDEKGVVSLDGEEFYTKHSFSMSMNPDGVFIFHPEESSIEGFDQDSVKEFCMALETALNSSSLNMKENPHLFTRGPLPPEYDPAKWGRTIDPESWALHRDPDFSGFINELRSDIYKTFSDSQIIGFSMKIDDQGKLTITNVKTEGNDPKANARATEQINRGLTYEIEKKAEYLGLLMLSAHHSVNGDVLTAGTILEPFDDGSIGNIKQFKHEVVITSDSDYKVISADSSRTAKPKHEK